MLRCIGKKTVELSCARSIGLRKGERGELRRGDSRYLSFLARAPRGASFSQLHLRQLQRDLKPIERSGSSTRHLRRARPQACFALRGRALALHTPSGQGRDRIARVSSNGGPLRG